MAAGIYRLRTKADLLNEEQAENLRQLLLRGGPELPDGAVGNILAAIDSNTAAKNGWTFVMMSPADNAKVVSWLAANSKRPMIAMQLWAALFLHLRRDTGEVMQTRDELAATVGTTSDHVSEIMTELESIGAISRKRVKVAGMRGPGTVRYFMSPRIATHLAGKARDVAQAEAGPLLRVMEGGRAD